MRRFRFHGFICSAISTCAIGCGSASASDEPPARQQGEIGATLRPGPTYGHAVYREPTEPPCGVERLGECSFVESCLDGNPIIIPPTKNPGVVTVQGTPLELDPSGQLYLSELDAVLVPGDVVEMSATGSDEVPAHHGQVVVPEVTSVLDPAFVDVVPIERSRDLEVQWTPIADGHVGVGITVPFSPVGSANVSCGVPAKHGRLTIPSELLERLPASDAAANMPATISFSQGNSVNLRPDGWDVWLRVGGTTASANAEIR